MSFLRSVIADARPRRLPAESTAVAATGVFDRMPDGAGATHWHGRGREARPILPVPDAASSGVFPPQVGSSEMDEVAVQGTGDGLATPEDNGLAARPVMNAGPDSAGSGSISRESGPSRTRLPDPAHLADGGMDASTDRDPTLSGRRPASGDKEAVFRDASPDAAVTGAGGQDESQTATTGHAYRRAHGEPAEPGSIKPAQMDAMAVGQESRSLEMGAETFAEDFHPDAFKTPKTPTSQNSLGKTAAFMRPQGLGPVESGRIASDDAVRRDGALNAPSRGAKVLQPAPDHAGQQETDRFSDPAPPPGMINQQATGAAAGRDPGGPSQAKALKPQTALVAGRQPADRTKPGDDGASEPVPPTHGEAAAPTSRPDDPSAGSQPPRSLPARPLQMPSMPRDGRAGSAGRKRGGDEKTRAAPTVQIGQIDVLIQAPAAPPAKKAPASIDVASRLFLRRL